MSENREKVSEAVKHSNCNAPIAPTAVAVTTTEKQIKASKALKAGFSETLAIFTVIICGKDCNGKEYRISNVYEEYHPLMAVGRAVVEFRKTIIVGSIEHILISERVVSNK